MNIVIFEDEKTGHTNQSKAIARLLKQVLSIQGAQTDIKTVKIIYKSIKHYRLLSLFGFFNFPFLNSQNFKFLNFFLTQDSFKNVIECEASFVISTGSPLASINFLVSRINGAKNIVILKPGLLSYTKFSLVVLPEHDRPKYISPKANIVFTDAAPNLIDKAYIDQQTQSLLARYSHLKKSLRMKIGLFLGGNSKTVFISDQQGRLLIQQLKEIIKDMKVDLLITTSRRTPHNIESMFLKEFRKNPSCLLLVQPNKEDIPEAMGGIVGLSDILLVSGDSISMISEAASSGKKTIVFTPQVYPHAKVNNKHINFIDNLSKQGFILSTDIKNIGQAVYNVAKNKIYTRQLKDNQILLDALKEIV